METNALPIGTDEIEIFRSTAEIKNAAYSFKAFLVFIIVCDVGLTNCNIFQLQLYPSMAIDPKEVTTSSIFIILYIPTIYFYAAILRIYRRTGSRNWFHTLFIVGATNVSFLIFIQACTIYMYYVPLQKKSISIKTPVPLRCSVCPRENRDLRKSRNREISSSIPVEIEGVN